MKRLLNLSAVEERLEILTRRVESQDVLIMQLNAEVDELKAQLNSQLFLKKEEISGTN